MAISIPHAQEKYRNNEANLFSLTLTFSREVSDHIVYGWQAFDYRRKPVSAIRLPNAPHAKLTQSLSSHFQPRM